MHMLQLLLSDKYSLTSTDTYSLSLANAPFWSPDLTTSNYPWPLGTPEEIPETATAFSSFLNFCCIIVSPLIPPSPQDGENSLKDRKDKVPGQDVPGTPRSQTSGYP